MVILKKIRASTLVETLAASVIIIIVFVIGSLSLNNVFYTSIKNDDDINNHIKELKYKLLNNKIALPFYQQTDLWDIAIINKNENIVFSVLNKKTDSQQIILIND